MSPLGIPKSVGMYEVLVYQDAWYEEVGIRATPAENKKGYFAANLSDKVGVVFIEVVDRVLL